MAFNEDSRVKLPAILHLCRLGYEYISLKDKDIVWDKEANIFPAIFRKAVGNINQDFEDADVERLLQEIKLTLDNEDLGKAFYDLITSKSGKKIIDFNDFSNNQLHVVTELTYKNGDEEFRPDITLLINGLPLVFIEVKKPNNKDGILAERERINRRFQNSKFRKFVNITQMMIFSNNMEYDDFDIEPLQGAFYSTTSYKKPIFNYFREEENLSLCKILKPEDDATENFVLKDNNLVVIKQSPEFLTNKNPESPTNRILTSLCSKDRLKFILEYAIAYVKNAKGIEKHIMRYPQLFASRAIRSKIDGGLKKGIIWHTQGSGKTALAYYSVKYLTDYYQSKGIIPKFLFIVDRLDLLKQAKREFSSRGLIVHLVNSREEFANDIKITTALHNNSGNPEITVVNIHKFSEDSKVISETDYNIKIQRVYFLDEVHRSYNPTGSFLANLFNSDKKSIKIGLTGTPLISKKYKSRELFGDYIHKYYYNASIADGYTLRLIREEISSDYKIKLENVLKEIDILKGEFKKREVFSHQTFVEPMLDYIVNDFEKSRLLLNDSSIGAMIVCDSAPQAKMMFKIFNEQYSEEARATNEIKEEFTTYSTKQKNATNANTSALILHDIGNKEDRDDWVESFKAGNIDLLFVFNMLLIGFDAKRLKKLYLGRVVNSHNLLQTLTRVNRPYKNFRYGYVVDFADISSQFDATNRAYLKELQSELGDDIEHYSSIFKSKEEMEQEIEEIKNLTFKYNTENAEIFSQQISKVEDRREILKLKKALENARGLYNIIQLEGYIELLEKLDFKKLNELYRETINHLALLNAREAIEKNIDNTNLLNIALEDVIFYFTKISEEELILADELKGSLRKTREAFASNQDKKDSEFITLYEELKRLFDKKNLSEVTQSQMKNNIGTLNKIYAKIKELNRQNNLLKNKYNGDPKYMRIHKRMMDIGDYSKNELKISEALANIKESADLQVLQNTNLMNNESFFEKEMIRLVIDQFNQKSKFNLTTEPAQYVNNLIVTEYLKEFNGRMNYE